MIPRHPAESPQGEGADPALADPAVVVPLRSTSSVQQEIEDAARQVLRGVGDLSEEQRRALSAQIAQASLQHLAFEHGCPIHNGSIHGGEAEDLRSGIERLLAEAAPSASPWVSDPEHEDMQDLRSDLQALLDAVDARDSLAHLDRSSPPEAHSDAPEAIHPSLASGALDKYVRTHDEELKFAEEKAMGQAALAIADLIAHASITQTQIAGRAGISANQVAQILCADGDPTLRAIARIGRAAGREMQISFGSTTTGHEVQASPPSLDTRATAAVQPATDPRLALSIDHLDLPGRALTTLARHRIRTVGDLTRQRADDLTRLAGGGPRLVTNVSEALERLGLSLAQASGPTDALRQIAHLLHFARSIDAVPDGPIGPCEADQIVRATQDRLAHARWEVDHLTQGLIHAQRVARDLAAAIAADPSATQATRAHAHASIARLAPIVESPSQPSPADEIEDSLVAHLDLPLRAESFLTTHGIRTIAHLADRSEADLRKMGAIPHVIQQIREEMQRIGRPLRASADASRRTDAARSPRSPNPTSARQSKKKSTKKSTTKTRAIVPRPRAKTKRGSARATSGSIGRRDERRGDA